MTATGASQRFPRAFTLLEMVLAIALSSAVLYLLTTAIEMYLVREDAARAQVESCQVARAILDQIAADLKSLQNPPEKLAANQPASSGQNAASDQSSGGAQASGSFSATAEGGGMANSAAGDESLAGQTTQAMPLYGDSQVLRIDCGPRQSWTRVTREVAPGEAAGRDALPRTVRYFVGDGKIVDAASEAARGVATVPLRDQRGLSRESIPTAALDSDAEPGSLETLGDAADFELLAPEIVELSFLYYLGEETYDTWMAGEQTTPPDGVEVSVKVLQMTVEEASSTDVQRRFRDGRFSETDVVEFRRFVRLRPALQVDQRQALLFPSGAQQGQNRGGGGGAGQGTGGSAGGGGGQGAPGGGPS
ncbi:MAG: hypothetical protein KDA61_15655 [Planctomycetales bacterium]|nr:hypothetical protein [Planctomycetales bacterium]